MVTDTDMDTDADSEKVVKRITTGNTELDKKLGGSIPLGSLTMIEGQSDSGKSVLTQQMISGSLRVGMRITEFTTENTVKSLLSQMDSLGFDVLDYLLLGRLKIFPVRAMKALKGSEVVLERLMKALTSQRGQDLVVIDSITSFVAHSSVEEVITFFEECKDQCDSGLTIIVVAHTYAFNESLLVRINSMCDAHLRLYHENMGDKLVKIMEVAKVRGAKQKTGNVITFDVEPGLGIKIMPFSKARA